MSDSVSITPTPSVALAADSARVKAVGVGVGIGVGMLALFGFCAIAAFVVFRRSGDDDDKDASHATKTADKAAVKMTGVVPESEAGPGVIIKAAKRDSSVHVDVESGLDYEVNVGVQYGEQSCDRSVAA